MLGLDDPVPSDTSAADRDPEAAHTRQPADGAGLDRIVRWVLAVMIRILGDRDRVTAAVSQAVIDYLRASRRQTIDHVAAWLLAVAKKKALLPDEQPSGMASLDDVPGGEVPLASTAPAPSDVQSVERALVVELMRRTAFRGHQLDVLSLLREGLTPPAIASRLELPLGTVERSRASGCARVLRTAEGSRFAPDLQALVDRLLGPRPGRVGGRA